MLVKLLLAVLFYATPLIGVWVASSLAAYLGGPHFVSWTIGLLLFPIIPGIWELHAYAYRKEGSKAWLTPLDRLSLRTFVVGAIFLVGLLYVYPQTAFVSLSTRGDWMLDGMNDTRALTARHYLFQAAGALEWLYKANKENQYKAHIDAEARKRSEEAAKERKQEVAQQEHEKELAQQQHDQQIAQQKEKESSQLEKKEKEKEKETVTVTSNQETHKANPPVKLPVKKWPWQDYLALHHAVVSIPEEEETSIKAVAKYIAKNETDPVLRIKALHDYVADRIAYDSEALYSGNMPDQSAEAIFKARKGVCAGYANLLSALAAAIKEKIIVVTGDARDPDTGDKLTGEGHAWNAARIGKKWYLIDSCWDAGYVNSREAGFKKQYKTDYLLTPPEVMIQDHFPEEADWQLLAQPLSQGEFLRQPMLRPSFQAAELSLVSPQRARMESDKAVAIVKNPSNQWLMAGLEQNGKELGDAKSTETNSDTSVLEYPLPNKGTYRMNIFLNPKHERYGQYSFVGSVDFVNR